MQIGGGRIMEKEIIIKIELDKDFKIKTQKIYGGTTIKEYEGLEITTNKSVYRFGISTEQQCCENWGYIDTVDNPDDFIGAELLDVDIYSVDTPYNNLVTALKEGKVEINDAEFITVKTNKGTFQFAVYNSHNGYYSHDVIFQKGDNVKRFSI